MDVLEQQLPYSNGDDNASSGFGVGVGTGVGNNSHSSLSPEEEEYFRLYSDLLAAYKGQWTDIDLTGSVEPPTDLFIDVRVLKDAGEIQTEYGYVPFFSSSYIFLRLFSLLILVGSSICPRGVSCTCGRVTWRG